MEDIDKSLSSKKHYSLLTIVIGAIVAIGRIKLNSNNDEDITTIMSVVNVVAFGFVLILLCNDVYDLVKQKISSSGVSTTNKRNMKIILEILFLLFLGMFTFYGVKYVIEYKCATYNDAISILALAISIANDGFVKCIENPLYKVICLINKCRIKVLNISRQITSNISDTMHKHKSRSKE